MTDNTNQDLVPRHEDRAFNPARRSASQALDNIVSQAIDVFLCQEQQLAPLGRARSQANTQKLELCTEALISDLTHRVLTMGKMARVHIGLGDHDLGGASRYRPPALGKITKKLIEMLSLPESGPWIVFHPRREAVNERSSLSAGPKLLALIEAAEITKHDLAVSNDQPELIALKRSKKTDSVWWGRPKGTLVDYPETEDTLRMREEVKVINAYLEKLDLFMVPGGPHVDLSARPLRRVFSEGSFACGGRLWGLHAHPFWYDLKSGKESGINERQEYLLIDGEPIEEVDIKACSLTILYALEGLPLPNLESPYVPPQFDTLVPGAEKPPKEAFKPLFQAALNRDRRYPAWAEKKHGDLVCCSPQEALEALEDLHAPVAHYLHRSFGHQVMRMESDILVDCLVRHGAELSALPLHDCLIVPTSKAEEAERRLKEAFQRRLGQVPIISFK
ncbi:hypothetical protein [Maricaulis maris]|uniref:hypothetical protein n=1 Tax=Maricaulis maris TaxID=74318 RepID=UPI002923A4E2|nr:hypothetical protein MACH15_09690 [Maricaulis maris]